MNKPINPPTPRYVTCRCQHCDGNIEFDANELVGENSVVPCPHCGQPIQLRKPLSKIPISVYVTIGALAVISIFITQWWKEHPQKAEATKAATPALIPAPLELDTPQAIRTKAEKGNVLAQAKLGLIYGNGLGMPVDYVEAVKWYRKAAEQGDANAQNNLGLMYKGGLGVTIDYLEASNWFRKSAEQGLAKAQFNLAEMYEERLIAENKTDALSWFRRAAEQGYIPAQTRLAYCSEYGVDVPEDETETLKWYRIAAEQGDADGQAGLAHMYITGRVVPEDNVEAYKWLFLAVAQGAKGYAIVLDKDTQNFSADEIAKIQKTQSDVFSAGVKLLAALSKAMTDEQIAEATRRAQSYLDSRPHVNHDQGR